jgi:hypothetical protein
MMSPKICLPGAVLYSAITFVDHHRPFEPPGPCPLNLAANSTQNKGCTMSQKFFTRIDELKGHSGLKPCDRDRMETVCQKFLFRASEYYLSLIDRGEMRRLV